MSQLLSNRGGKNFRINFRIPTYTLPEKSLEVLFTIASIKKEILITQKLLADTIKRPITTINYQITKLKREGLINKKNQLTEKGKTRTNPTVSYF